MWARLPLLLLHCRQAMSIHDKMWGVQSIQRKVAQGSIGSVYLGRFQETDVAVKALRGLEDLQRIVKLAPDGTRSNPSALNSWLVHSGVLQDSGSLCTLQSLEREVCPHL